MILAISMIAAIMDTAVTMSIIAVATITVIIAVKYVRK